jgi:hypothetical protein
MFQAGDSSFPLILPRQRIRRKIATALQKAGFEVEQINNTLQRTLDFGARKR